MNALERFGEIFVRRLVDDNRLHEREHPGGAKVYRSYRSLMGPMADDADEARGWNHVLEHLDRKSYLRTATWTEILDDLRVMLRYKDDSASFRRGVREAVKFLFKEFGVKLSVGKKS